MGWDVGDITAATINLTVVEGFPLEALALDNQTGVTIDASVSVDPDGTDRLGTLSLSTTSAAFGDNGTIFFEVGDARTIIFAGALEAQTSQLMDLESANQHAYFQGFALEGVVNNEFDTTTYAESDDGATATATITTQAYAHPDGTAENASARYTTLSGGRVDLDVTESQAKIVAVAVAGQTDLLLDLQDSDSLARIQAFAFGAFGNHDTVLSMVSSSFAATEYGTLTAEAVVDDAGTAWSSSLTLANHVATGARLVVDETHAAFTMTAVAAQTDPLLDLQDDTGQSRITAHADGTGLTLLDADGTSIAFLFEVVGAGALGLGDGTFTDRVTIDGSTGSVALRDASDVARAAIQSDGSGLTLYDASADQASSLQEGVLYLGPNTDQGTYSGEGLSYVVGGDLMLILQPTSGLTLYDPAGANPVSLSYDNLVDLLALI